MYNMYLIFIQFFVGFYVTWTVVQSLRDTRLVTSGGRILHQEIELLTDFF